MRTENLEVLPYRRDHLVLVVPRSHELAQASSVRFTDTLDYNYVGLHEFSTINAFLPRECEHLGRNLKLRIQAGNYEAACRMIEATVGVAILTESAARRHAQTMAITIVPLSDTWAIRDMQICVRSLDALPAFTRELVDLLVEDAKVHNAARAEQSGAALAQVGSRAESPPAA